MTNAATGEFLPSATIRLRGTALGVVTDRDGSYSLALPPGDYTAITSFPGLDAVERAFTTRAGATVRADFALPSGVYKMDTFAVSGVREGNARAIQLQRHSANPKWVAATDTFGNPAANPGELIQRLPGVATDIVGSEVRSIFIRGMGPGFSSLMIDGERVATSTGNSGSRDYQIEQFGTGNVESVELIKAPTPDQDANAVAGFANLVTRRAFDLPGRRVTLSAGTGWRVRGYEGGAYNDRPNGLDLLSLVYSDVYSVGGEPNNLGISFNLSRRASATTQDEIGPSTNIAQTYLNVTSASPLTRVFGSSEFGADAIAYNAGLAIDYKLSADGYVFTKLTFNDHDQFQESYGANFGSTSASLAQFAPGSTYENSELLAHPASTGALESALHTKKALSYGVVAGTEFKLFRRAMTVSIRGSYSHANINYPGRIIARASTTAPIGFVIDRRGRSPWYPAFTQRTGPSIFDAGSYVIDSYSRQTQKAPNDLYGGRLDVTHRLSAGNLPMVLKSGVKFNDDFRRPTADFAEYTWVGADGAPRSSDDALSAYLGGRYPQGDGRYGPFPFTAIPGTGRAGDVLRAPNGYWRQTAANAYNSVASSLTPDARFRETIRAGYVQASTQTARVRVLAGVRVEETRTIATAWVRNTTASWGGNSVGGASLDPVVVANNALRAQRSFVRRNTADGRYRNVFPGVHLVYEPAADLLVRASYNRSISRPTVANLLPTITENSENRSITMGNPDLRPYFADNFEASVEKYFEPVGLISVGAFQKNISDYTRSISSVVPPEGVDGSGQYAGYTATITQNVGDARIRGVELSYQQQFSFLPSFWQGLGGFANFTYLQTEGNFGGTVTVKRLSNLAPRTMNAGLNFRGFGLDVRLLVNWTDRKFRTTSGGVDIFYDERLNLDLKLQYSIRRNIDLFLDATNLTDEPSRAEVTLNGLHYSRLQQGVGFFAGLRVRL